jgi:hypothetical protein
MLVLVLVLVLVVQLHVEDVDCPASKMDVPQGQAVLFRDFELFCGVWDDVVA